MDLGISREFALSIAARSPMCSSDGGEARLQAYVTSLEEEKRKIEAFKRDLPLSVHLLNDVIQVLNRDLEQRRGRTSLRIFGQVITTEIKSQEQDELGSNSERSGVQFTRGGGGVDQFTPVEGYPTQKLTDGADNGSDLTIFATALGNGVGRLGSKVALGVLVSDQLNLLTPTPPAPLPPPRKARRCWSKELHGQFLSALELLGGAQFATPKQIREVMNVEGLTSDQVRSHLQKHRLNVQKMSNSSNAVNGPQVQRNKPLKENATRQSGSDPQTFLHLASFNIGDSCEEQGDQSGV